MDQNEILKRIENLENLIREHNHSGNLGQRVNFFDVLGKFETVSVAPTGSPRTASEQVKVYVNGATLRLYWYDTSAGVWHYVTATA